jgi:hypothetical protein
MDGVCDRCNEVCPGIDLIHQGDGIYWCNNCCNEEAQIVRCSQGHEMSMMGRFMNHEDDEYDLYHCHVCHTTIQVAVIEEPYYPSRDI